MDKIKLDDFLKYKFLSGLKVQKEGIFFTVATSKKDKSGYDRNLATIREGQVRYLTADGKFGASDIKDGKVYFIAKRTDEEKKETSSTTIYALPLDGGEAYPWKTIPAVVSSFTLLGDDILCLTQDDLRLEGYSGEEKEKKAKEIADYEEITETSFYSNGEDFIAGRRNRAQLFRNGKLERLFPGEDFSIESLSFSEDKTKVLITGAVKTPKASLYAEVREVNCKTLEWKTLLEDKKLGVSGVWYCGSSILLAGSPMDKYGCNQNADFYLYRDGAFTLLKTWGEALYGSVGTDICLGGGAISQSKDGWVYFITTLDHSSYVYRINEEGTIESVIGAEGAVNAIAVHEGKTYFIGLRDQKLQEIYDDEEKQLTTLNSKVLKGKYVAVPEEVQFQNDGIDFTGWVLKPYGYVEGKKYPAIYDIHGGPKTVYGTVFMHEMQYWANEGYFVFWTNPRGADGRGDAFADIRGKYGTIDYSDLMKFVDVVLEKYPDIDKERLGETGGSYGGFMSNWILGHTDRFKAIATQRSIYNWISFWGTSDIGPFFAEDQCAAGMDNIEGLFHRSPMEAIVKNAKTPTLIIHSDKDYRCPVEQAYQLFNALVNMDVETRMVLFHDETHELSRSGKPSNRIKRLAEITNWMNDHLK